MTDPSSFLEHLFDPAARDVEVATDGLTAGALLRDAARVAERIVATRTAPSDGPGEVSFAFGEDRSAFAAALLGTWMAGHTAALPLDAARDDVAPVLKRAENVAFLHDTGVGTGVFVPELLSRGATVAPPDPGRALRLPERPVAFFARGSDRPIFRPSAAELVELLEAWRERLALRPGELVAGCHTPTAWPGVAFELLLPLHARARFAAARDVQAACDVLVAPTALLRRRARSSAADLPALPTRAIHVGEPLDPETLRRVEASGRGLRVLDGGALVPDADAVQRDAAWRALARPLRDALLADARVDDVAMLAAPDVEDATGARPRVLVAIAGADLDDATLAELSALGVDDGVDFELRAFPRIPREDNGVFPAPLLYLAFGRGRGGQAIERGLVWDERTDEADRASATRTFVADIPSNYLYFEGHFPTYPVLAGAVQLDALVLPCLRRAFPDAKPLRRARTLKFLERIRPGDRVELVLTRKDESEVSFSILRDGVRCTTGQLSLGDA